MNSDELRGAFAIRDPFFIQLYCHEPSHEKKRWNICRFQLFDHGDHSSWGPDWTTVQSVRRQMLHGDRRLPSVMMTTPGDGYDEVVPRGRYLFRCAKCGLSLPMREETDGAVPSRWRDLERFLDKLASVGASEISLTLVIANV